MKKISENNSRHSLPKNVQFIISTKIIYPAVAVFYSDDPSSNPAEVCIFNSQNWLKIIVKEAGDDVIVLFTDSEDFT